MDASGGFPVAPEARASSFVWTPEGQAEIAAVRADWQAVAARTGASDRARAEAGVRAVYAAAGLDQPERLLWCASPPALLRAMLPLVVEPLEGLGDEDQNEAADRIWHDLFDPLRDRLHEERQARFGADRDFRISETIRREVSEPLADQDPFDLVYERALEELGDDGSYLEDFFDATPDGHGDDLTMLTCTVATLADLDAWSRLFGLHMPEVAGFAEVQRAAGWWWPFTRVAIVSDRPAALRPDPGGRGHLLAYADGFAVPVLARR